MPPSARVCAGDGHSARSSAGSLSVAQSAAAAARPYCGLGPLPAIPKCPVTPDVPARYPSTGSRKHPAASRPRRIRRRHPRTVSAANTTTGTISTAPISRTVTAAPSSSAPDPETACGHGPGRHSSTTSPAAIIVSNSTSGMIVCSSWSWYASSSTGAAASVATHRGAPRRSSTAYSATAMASPNTCWTAATSASPPAGSSSRSSAWYPCGAVATEPSRYLTESMYSRAGR